MSINNLTFSQRGSNMFKGIKDGLKETWSDPKKRGAAMLLIAAASASPVAGALISTCAFGQGVKTLTQASNDLKNAKTPEEEAAAWQKSGKGVASLSSVGTMGFGTGALNLFGAGSLISALEAENTQVEIDENNFDDSIDYKSC